MEANGLITEREKVVAALDPSADLYNTDPASDIFNMAGYNKCTFLLFQGPSTSNTGNATITVEAVDNVAGSNATALPFKYRKKAAGADATWGAITAATTSGFTTTANETTIYEIVIEDADLPESQQYVRAVFTEATDDPVTGSCIAMLTGGRYKDPNQIDPLT